MIKILTSFVLVLGLQQETMVSGGEAIIKKMYSAYAGKWYRSYTFDQTTEMYHNDSLKRSETWYEAVQFPNNFRIDFGVSDSGNAVIFKNDSAYNFKNGHLRSVHKDENDITFLLGGMYFYTFKDTKEKLKGLGYDIKKMHEDTLQGKQVYVVGADKGEQANQLWIDKERLILLRMISFDSKRKLECLFQNHIKLNGGWTETKVIIYVNDQLVQVEHYHNCRTDLKLDGALFIPEKFTKASWHK